MIDTVIVSGGMIQKDFALDFIRKIEEDDYDEIEVLTREAAFAGG